MPDKSGHITHSAVVDIDQDGYQLMPIKELVTNVSFLDRLDEYDVMLESGANESI